MKKFKLFALALAIGTGSLFAASVVGSDDPDMDEEYESQELFEEAYGDSDFYKNLAVATITDENQGLEIFETFLNENYKIHLNDDNLILDNDIEQSRQRIKVCINNQIMDKKIKYVLD